MDNVDTAKLRVFLSEGLAHPKLATLLARQRAEEPGVRIQLTETDVLPASKRFANSHYDIGIARSADFGNGWMAVPLWREPWVVAARADSPLGCDTTVPVDRLLDSALIQWDPAYCRENHEEMAGILGSLGDRQPLVTRTTRTFDLMMTLVASGHGVTIAPASRVNRYRAWGVNGQPLTGATITTTVHLIRQVCEDVTSAWWRFSQRALSTHWGSDGRLAPI